MLSAEANVATDRPSRYLVQLCQHVEQLHDRAVKHHGGEGPASDAKVEFSETEGSIDFGWARCTVRASRDTLTLHAEAPDEASLRRLQDLVGERVTQIGRRDGLTVEWEQAPAASPGPWPPNWVADRPKDRTADASTGPPRWAKVFGIVAIVVVVLVSVMLLSGHNPGRHGGQGRPATSVSVDV
jgi:hypothetical protein